MVRLNPFFIGGSIRSSWKGSGNPFLFVLILFLSEVVFGVELVNATQSELAKSLNPFFIGGSIRRVNLTIYLF